MTLKTDASSGQQALAASPSSRRIGDLADLLARQAGEDGIWPTPIPGLSVIRFSKPSEEIAHALHQPAVCIIAQGAKRVMLRNEVFSYDASRFLVFSVDLPISAQVTDATADAPYLCFRLDLDPATISALLLKAGYAAAAHEPSGRGLFLTQVSDTMVDAAVRLMKLLESPDDASMLAPLAVQELHYRLLRTEQGARLASIAQADSHACRIARTIAWLKTHFAEPLSIEALAREAHMSTSSLHFHFRNVTSMSPLQYQKLLRLQEARRLLVGETTDVSDAGYRVGYESPSQFSREYSRLFGLAPSRDAQRLRASGAVAVY
jgi:AraC-like DNA-binding protein